MPAVPGTLVPRCGASSCSSATRSCTCAGSPTAPSPATVDARRLSRARRSWRPTSPRMAANGLNALRTYTVPPRWLLDAALRHGLWVMVGLAWEQHVDFLDERPACRFDRAPRARGRGRLRRASGGALLRGRQRDPGASRALDRTPQGRAVRRAPPARGARTRTRAASSPMSTTRRPSTCAPPASDIVCFNVYLETPDRLDAYLARLQNLAGDRPLMMTELGLDSRAHGLRAPGRGARLADPHGSRERLRGRVRVLVDGRVARLVPVRDRREQRQRGVARLGLRAHRSRPAAQARARGGAGRVGRALPFPVAYALATGVGGRLHVQRSAHAGTLPGRGRATRLSGLRGDRRRRRLHRRNGRDRRAATTAR